MDANILLYATDADSPFHEPARAWMEADSDFARFTEITWINPLAA